MYLARFRVGTEWVGGEDSGAMGVTNEFRKGQAPIVAVQRCDRGAGRSWFFRSRKFGFYGKASKFQSLDQLKNTPTQQRADQTKRYPWVIFGLWAIHFQFPVSGQKCLLGKTKQNKKLGRCPGIRRRGSRARSLLYDPRQINSPRHLSISVECGSGTR